MKYRLATLPLLALVWLLSWVMGSQAEAVRLMEMRIQAHDSFNTQLVFALSNPARHTLFPLEPDGRRPHRLVIDLHNTRLLNHLIRPAENHPLLENIRSGMRDDRDLRIVLDLKVPVNYHEQLLPAEGNKSHRLVVSLTPQNIERRSIFPRASSLPASVQAKLNTPRATPTESVPKPKPAVAPRPPLPEPREAIRPAPPPAQVSRVPRQTPLADYPGRKVVVAIDAGHGGVDPGALGHHGSKEKEVVFAIARELASLVKQTPGLKPAMIRDGDYFLSLRQRIERARQYQADLFISIHADAYKKGYQVQGSSVYMLSSQGASSEAAQWLAEKENSADLMGGVSLSDKDDVLASVLLDLSQAGTLDASAQLGNQVLRALGQVGPLHLDRVQQAGFIVLRSPDIPSILVETGFISDAAEERKLNTPAHRQRIARALLHGIQAYLAHHAPPGTLLARRNSSQANQ